MQCFFFWCRFCCHRSGIHAFRHTFLLGVFMQACVLFTSASCAPQLFTIVYPFPVLFRFEDIGHLLLSPLCLSLSLSFSCLFREGQVCHCFSSSALEMSVSQLEPMFQTKSTVLYLVRLHSTELPVMQLLGHLFWKCVPDMSCYSFQTSVIYMLA